MLYALLGLAAGKAKSALEKAIAIDPDYACSYIGMANLHYILARKPFDRSKDPNDVDQVLPDYCFKYLEKAMQAPEKSPLAEAGTKIRLSGGQCYSLKLLK